MVAYSSSLRATIHRRLPRPEMQRDRRTNLHQAAEDREAERLQKIIDFRVCNRKKKSKLISKSKIALKNETVTNRHSLEI